MMESSSAIEPRMSVCLKGSLNSKSKLLLLHDAAATQEHERISLAPFRFVTVEDRSDDDTITTRNASSSSLLTGTPSSILSTSLLKVNEERTQRNRIRFSEIVHVRNHIHVRELTREERVAAWFRKSEYHGIFKNNTKIISTLGKREKEEKRKKRREKKKKRWENRRNSISQTIYPDDSSVCTDGTESVCDSIHFEQHTIGIHRDDEQGFSVRGLENETANKRRIRDQSYLKARFAVLSIQEDVDEHMFSMQEECLEKLSKIELAGKKASKKIIKLRMSPTKNQSVPPELKEEEIERIRVEKTEAIKEEFSAYASSQYHGMISKIAKSYGDLCKQHFKEAFERGLQDEQAARAIDWIETDHREKYSASQHSSGRSIQSTGKGTSDTSEQMQFDKRRPSTTSTAATEESSASAALFANDGSRLGRMKRAKNFLWNLVIV